MEYIAYCVKCKKKVKVDNPNPFEMKGKGKKKAVRGKCSECGTKVCVILKKED